MSLPVSGQLSLLDICKELKDPSTNISLTSMSFQACKTSPNGVSEFYGYTKPSISLDPSVITATYNGVCTPDKYVLTTNVSTYIKYKSPEIIISPTYDVTIFNISVSTNTSSNPKNLSLIIETSSGCSSSDVSSLINITQEAMPNGLTFDPSTYRINYGDPLSKVIKAISPASITWTYESLPSKIISIEPSIFTGTTDLTITSERNVSSLDLAPNITFILKDTPTVKSVLPALLVNAGPTPSIGTSGITTFSSSAESKIVTITSTHPWTCDIAQGSFETPFTVVPSSGVAGNTNVTISCPLNNATTNSGTVTFRITDSGYYTSKPSQTLNITQYASAPYFTITNVPQTINWNARFIPINISTNDSWAASLDNTSLGTLSQTSGNKDTILSFNDTTDNLSTYKRSTILYFVKSTGNSQYNLIQNGCPISYTIDPGKTINYSAVGQQFKVIKIHSNAPWKIDGYSNGAHFVFENITTGQQMPVGDVSFGLKCTDNLTGSSRTGTISISFLGDTAEGVSLTINQDKTPILTFANNPAYHDPQLTEMEFTKFTSSDPSLKWYLITPPSSIPGYIHTTELSTGYLSNNLYYALDMNYTATEHPFVVRYSLSENSAIYADLTLISVPHPHFNINPSILAVDNYNQNVYSLNLTSGDSWSLSKGLDWCTVSPTNGTGDASITVSILQNKTVSARNDTIAFKPNGLAAFPISISQPAGPYLSLTADQNIVYNGTFNSISIQANYPWTATLSGAWAGTLSATSGTGNANLTLTDTQKNTTTASRNATLTVVSEGITKVCNLTQQASPLIFDVSHNLQSFEPINSTVQPIQIYCNSKWKLTKIEYPTDPFTSMFVVLDNIALNTEYTGDMLFGIKTTDSTFGYPQEATLTFECEGTTKTVKVIEKDGYGVWFTPETLELNPSTLVYPVNPSMNTPANLNWIYSIYALDFDVTKIWLDPSVINKNTTTVNIHVDPCVFIEPNNVTINFLLNEGPTRQGSIPITIPEPPSYFVINPSVLEMPKYQSTGNVKVLTGNTRTWTASSNQYWCMTGAASGTGSNTYFSITCYQNSSGSARSAIITFDVTGIGKKYLTINQAG